MYGAPLGSPVYILSCLGCAPALWGFLGASSRIRWSFYVPLPLVTGLLAVYVAVFVSCPGFRGLVPLVLFAGVPGRPLRSSSSRLWFFSFSTSSCLGFGLSVRNCVGVLVLADPVVVICFWDSSGGMMFHSAWRGWGFSATFGVCGVSLAFSWLRAS